MTSDANKKNDDEDSMERPFTTTETIKLVVFCVVGYPLFLAMLLLSGPSIRSFPPKHLWYGFWVTEISIPCFVLASLPFLIHHPRVMRQRMSKFAAGKNESIAEQRFHKITTLLYLMGIVGMTYDASSEETSSTFPKIWNWIGAVSLALSFAWIIVVFRHNKYASRVVHVQPGQKLVTTGPYAVVRHPMYMAIVPSFCGFSLSIGSFWGLLPMGLCIVSIAIRTYDEERFLVETFGKEYESYRRKVPYKMIPFIY